MIDDRLYYDFKETRELERQAWYRGYWWGVGLAGVGMFVLFILVGLYA